MPLLRARVDLEAMAKKGHYSTFLNALKLEPHDQIVSYHIQDTHCSGVWGSYSFAEMHSVYSTVPANSALKKIDR